MHRPLQILYGQARQTLVTQVCPIAQGLPQAPQFKVSWVRFTHSPPQFEVGRVQPPHIPLSQVWPGAHGLLHPPQWAVLLVVFTQTVPHTCGAVGGHMHLPSMQAWVVAQATPHPPQLLVLLWVSMQAPAQNICPSGQAQPAAVQTWPVAQVLPQAPQFARSTVGSTQAVPHRMLPAGQAQLPPMQVVPPVQALPQTPQFSFDVASSTHPFPHLFSPAEHRGLQLPLSQTSSAEQTRPQAPQLLGSEARTTQNGPQAEVPRIQEQVPSTHSWFAGQMRSQAPQWSRAAFTSTQAARPQKLRPPGQLGVPQRPCTQA